MSRVRVVSFLGTAKYTEVEYKLDSYASVRGRLLDRALCSWMTPSGLLLLGTKQVREMWIESGAYREEVGLEPMFRLIPSGANPGDGWEIFRAVQEALSTAPIQGAGETAPPDEIVINLTNGFRAQPFFALGAISFTLSEWTRTATPPIPLRLLYGAYEDRDPVTGVAPVWDLTDFIMTARWNGALDACMRFGRADDLKVLAAMDAKEQVQREREAGKSGPALRGAGYARQLGEAVQRMADDLVFIRLRDIFTRSAPALHEAQGLDAAACLTDRLPPLRGALEQLKQWTEPLRAANVLGAAGVQAMKHLVARYHELQRYSEQMAVLEEGLVTAYAHAAGKPPLKDPGQPGCSEERRALDNLIGAIVHELSGRLQRAQAGANTAAVIVEVIREHNGGTQPSRGEVDCIQLLCDVKQLRNDVLHAGLRDSPSSASTLRAQLGELRRRFETLELAQS